MTVEHSRAVGRPPARRRGLRSTLVVLTTAVAVVVGSQPASATYYSYGVGTTKFSVAIVGVNPTWTGYLQHGITAWNGTSGTNVKISTTSSSKRTLTAGRYNQPWLGLYTAGGSHSDRSFTIQANAARIGEMTGSTFATWAKFTSTHELGHALSLADNPSTSKASIMKYVDPSATPYTTPRAYDTDEVKRIY